MVDAMLHGYGTFAGLRNQYRSGPRVLSVRTNILVVNGDCGLWFFIQTFDFSLQPTSTVPLGEHLCIQTAGLSSLPRNLTVSSCLLGLDTKKPTR